MQRDHLAQWPPRGALPTLLSCCLLVALSAPNLRAAETSAAGAAPPRLAALADAWFEAQLEHSPFFATRVGDPRFDDRMDFAIDPAVRERFRTEAERVADGLGALSRETLGVEDRVTYDALAWDLRTTLALLAFPAHRMPLEPSPGAVPFELARLATGHGHQPFASTADYEAFLRRLRQFPRWVELAVRNAREGARRGIVQPRPVVLSTVLRLERLAGSFPDRTPFDAPLERFPESVPDDERQRLRRAFRKTIRGELGPAYRRLAEVWRREVLPASRDSLSWRNLPDGEAWYRALVARAVTREVAPADLLALGREEVARIVGEIEAEAERSEHDGLVALLTAEQQAPEHWLQTPEEVMARSREILQTIRRHLPEIVDEPLAGEVVLHGIRPEERVYLGAYEYLWPSPRTGRPGTMVLGWVEPFPIFDLDATLLGQALPGTHLPVDRLLHDRKLPRFRRFLRAPAWFAGWSLYSQGLGEELGVYRTRGQRLGGKALDLLRAARLVLDTGIHAGGWSHAEAREIAARHAYGSGEDEIVAYAARPAAAMAAKVGERALAGLRLEAETSLGDAFDLRTFHERILTLGPLPLPILEREIRVWIEAAAASSEPSSD